MVYDFTSDGGGLHKGGTGVLLVNGKKVEEGRIKTQGAVWSLAGDTADIRKGRILSRWRRRTHDPWGETHSAAPSIR